MMKKKLIFLPLFFMLLMGACRKDPSAPKGAMHRGVVIKNICCLIAVESIDSAAVGRPWIDSGNAARPSYSHAFTVTNPCQFGDYNTGDTINFIVVTPKDQNCACCLLYTQTPGTAYAIDVVK